MSFEDEMTQMSPEQVRQVVRDRLLEGLGVPWSEARGEPQWGLLRSSFLVWKQRPEQLEAFQSALSDVLTEAASTRRWGVVSEAAELCVALHAVEPKPNWPVHQWTIPQWMSFATESDDSLRASVALLQLARLHGSIDWAWCRDQFSKSVTRLFDGRIDPALERELQWLLSVWKALLSEMNRDDNPLPWFDLFRAVASTAEDKQRERLLDLSLASARSVMTSARMQAAIQSLEHTKLPADKELVLELMEENWGSVLPNCAAALTVAHSRLGRAAQVTEPAPMHNRMSLRSPSTAGETRWSEPCPAA